MTKGNSGELCGASSSPFCIKVRKVNGRGLESSHREDDSIAGAGRHPDDFYLCSPKQHSKGGTGAVRLAGQEGGRGSL